jgi:hypothetical protein
VKNIAGILIFTGFLAEWLIYIIYNKYLSSGGLVVPQPLHSFNIDMLLVIIGLIILWLASVQQSIHIRFSLLQIFCGLIIIILPLIYSIIRENWFMYTTMAAALLIIITGYFQLLKQLE